MAHQVPIQTARCKDITHVCYDCEHWNGGDGDKECLGCNKMLSRIPGIRSGRIKAPVIDLETLYRDQGKHYKVLSEKEKADKVKRLEVLESLIKKMPKSRARDVAALYIKGLSFTEIGGKLGISNGAAHIYFKRAIFKLRKAIHGKV